MKRSEKQKRSLSLIWATLTLCTGCIGYLLSRQWLFLMGGIAGFTLITTLKK